MINGKDKGHIFAMKVLKKVSGTELVPRHCVCVLVQWGTVPLERVGVSPASCLYSSWCSKKGQHVNCNFCTRA